MNSRRVIQVLALVALVALGQMTYAADVCIGKREPNGSCTGISISF